MDKERVEYDLASHAVNIIENSQKNTITPKGKVEKKSESDDYQL